jgi:glycosyltransferase involved in cell wall biosynthesis
MASGIDRKYRIVWLCHFADQELIKRYNSSKVKEFAPWISLLISSIEKQLVHVELYIVSPNYFDNSDDHFEKNGIHYFFYKRIPFPSKFITLARIYRILNIESITNYYWCKKKIKNIIEKINPHLVHLHGAENPWYSAGILPLIDKYNIFVTIQGFIRFSQENHNYRTQKMIIIEKEILKKSTHIGVRTDDMSKTILGINPCAILHFHNYPILIPSMTKNNIGKDERIDCIFFARVCKDKGIEDLLQAISIVKKINKSISLTIVGSATQTYLVYLESLCNELDIVANVNFTGFLPTQEDIYKLAIQAKICVLPTHFDIIPGTIIESMFMKLPVIAYNVGGISELNNKSEENIILVEKDNISVLSDKIILLLNNVDLRYRLAQDSYSFAMKKFNNEQIVNDLFKAYNSIANLNIPAY